MSKINQAEKAQGERSAPKNPVLADFEKKIEFYNTLHAKVKTMRLLKAHIENLEKLNFPDAKSPFEESPEQKQKIVLHVAYHEEYEIKNPTLMHEIREFIIGKIKGKLTEIEQEISTAQI
jgi:hypothetical protein